MSFKLIIRNNLTHDADSFSGSTVALFEEGGGMVGTSEECDCQVLDSQGRTGDQVWFGLEEKPGELRLWRKADLDIYLNQQLLTQSVATLTSGDLIRVGHWTFRLQKIYARPALSKQVDWSAWLCKGAIVLLIALQLLIALWLPGWLHYESLVADTVIEQKTVLLLDQTRRRVRRYTPSLEQAGSGFAALQLISAEVDRMATFIRSHQPVIARDHWLELRDDLEMYQELLGRIDRRELPMALPTLEVDPAVRAIFGEDDGEIADLELEP